MRLQTDRRLCICEPGRTSALCTVHGDPRDTSYDLSRLSPPRIDTNVLDALSALIFVAAGIVMVAWAWGLL
jgi:hypothetical protein